MAVRLQKIGGDGVRRILSRYALVCCISPMSIDRNIHFYMHFVGELLQHGCGRPAYSPSRKAFVPRSALIPGNKDLIAMTERPVSLAAHLLRSGNALTPDQRQSVAGNALAEHRWHHHRRLPPPNYLLEMWWASTPRNALMPPRTLAELLRRG